MSDMSTLIGIFPTIHYVTNTAFN